LELKNNLREYLLQIFPNYEKEDIDEVILFLIGCKYSLYCNVDDFVFTKLAANKVIERDFINERIIVNIPVFENDEAELTINRNIELSDQDINRYRSVFRGIRTGSIGTLGIVKERLYRFLYANPDYTIDDIIAAANHMTENTESMYRQNADNFIFNTKGQSPLLMVLEELKMGLSKNFN
jgi:hypothetical protein